MRNRVFYFVFNYAYNFLPVFFFKRKYKKLLDFERSCNQDELKFRLDYYLKIKDKIHLPDKAVSVKNFKKTNGTGYFLDLKEFLHYFKKNTLFAYYFGDKTSVNEFPTLVKARTIEGDNAKSILFKLNKNRHFYFVKDSTPFSSKKNSLVWRGGAYQKNRIAFVQKFWNKPNFNVGQTNVPRADLPWQKNRMSIAKQLQYKFIFCPEGNDVATNLKWVMSSNSLCFMPKPKFETWFMEGLLKPNIHYVEINSDLSDLESKIKYYSKHNDEALQIIENAHKHVAQFQNTNLEDLLCLKVLTAYTRLSQQMDVLKFTQN